MAFLYTSYDMQNLRLYGKRILEVFGIERGAGAVNVFPYAPHLAFWQTVFAGFASNMFILSTGGGKTIGTKGNMRFIQKIKPQCLVIKKIYEKDSYSRWNKDTLYQGMDAF